MNLLEDIAGLIFPRYCPGCEKKLTYKVYPVCPSCIHNLEPVSPQHLLRSLARLPEAQNVFTHALSLWYFDKSGTVQHIHQGLKYLNRPSYGSSLGILMGQVLISPIHPEKKPDVIIPIPLHPLRLLERGYNQSELLARGISKATRIPLKPHLLKRTRYTQTQTTLAKKDRLDNVKHAFEAPPSRLLKGAHVLLVDDVLTTGATLVSAAQILTTAGARAVSMATLALARI